MRQSSHILSTSSRLGASVYIQCLPASLAATRSIVLLTPNGLPQRMQAKGWLLFEHAGSRRGGAKIDLRLERDDFFRTGGLAQAALHASILGKAQHRLLGIVAERPGRAGRDAGKAQRAARHIEPNRAERRPRRQRQHGDGRGRQAHAVRAASGAGGCVCRRPAGSWRPSAARREAARRRARQPALRGSSVSIVATASAP